MFTEKQTQLEEKVNYFLFSIVGSLLRSSKWKSVQFGKSESTLIQRTQVHYYSSVHHSQSNRRRFPSPDEDELNDISTIRVGVFRVAKNYATWYTCLNCNKHLTDVPTLKSAKCNQFKAIMLLEACHKMVSVKVAIPDPANEERNLWLTVFLDVLWQMIPPTIRRGGSEDEVVERLLDLENFKIKLDKSTNIVISFQV